MITCIFSGGLGNNLFQLANVYAIHKLYGIELLLPSYTNRQVINQMNLDQEINLEIKNLFENVFNYIDKPIEEIETYEHVDKGINAVKEYVEVPLYDNLCYDGYFQSEKYFLGVDMSKEFLLKKENKSLVMNKYGYLFDKKTISLHYRLGGDRKFEHIQHYHKNVSLEFYKKALEVVGYDDSYNILVFTDSQNLCTELLKNINVEYTLVDNSNNNVLDFTLMSMCNHNILGNSTFSWWAAYMNQNSEKVVVAPESEWLGPGYSHFDLSDAFPKKWVKLKKDSDGRY